MTTRDYRLEEIAYNECIECATVCDNGTGYPSGLERILLPDTWDEAERLASEYGLDIIKVRIRGGHSFYENRGREWSPLCITDYVGECDEVYDWFDAGRAEKDCVALADWVDSDAEYEDIMSQKEGIVMEINSLAKDECVVVPANNIGAWYRTDYSSVHYRYDVYDYRIALCAPAGWGEDDEEDED